MLKIKTMLEVVKKKKENRWRNWYRYEVTSYWYSIIVIASGGWATKFDSVADNFLEVGTQIFE
jgi:hypothetical protein